MSEATGREAYPIHRLLAFDHSTGEFKHDQDDPLDGALRPLNNHQDTKGTRKTQT